VTVDDRPHHSPLDAPTAPLYIGALIVEAIVIALLWLFARAYW
jgi:hypothetical protein